jgi:hypothetical protein
MVTSLRKQNARMEKVGGSLTLISTLADLKRDYFARHCCPVSTQAETTPDCLVGPLRS